MRYLALSLILTACSPAHARAPVFDDAFWQHWGDGQAEIATYDLVFRRYGAPRTGTAATIFVTETFSQELRVKADPGRHPDSDLFPVMKLNLVRDFPTGVYDYNLMTSAFVAISARLGRPAGYPTKISFSSQEWCGHVYEQLIFDAHKVRSTRHSYFDGEADRSSELALPSNAIAEDALWHWARGLAAPVLKPGESRPVPMVVGLTQTRLGHRPLTLQTARLTHHQGSHPIETPAGKVVCRKHTATIDDGRTWTFYVEHKPPHRIVRWESSQGESATFVQSARLKYWRHNDPAGLELLTKLGLAPRAARTP